jgi:hypothetical protein
MVTGNRAEAEFRVTQAILPARFEAQAGLSASRCRTVFLPGEKL